MKKRKIHTVISVGGDSVAYKGDIDLKRGDIIHFEGDKYVVLSKELEIDHNRLRIFTVSYSEYEKKYKR